MGNDEAKWFDYNTTASLPGDIVASLKKIAWFRGKLNFGHRYFGVGQLPPRRWAVHLERGLAEPAIVVSAKPLLVVVYTGEFDSVAMLRFAQGLPDKQQVREGDRLLSVNTFERRKAEHRGVIERDLVPGFSAARSVWFNVHPAIADFLSDDEAAIAERKAQIPAGSWAQLEDLASDYRAQFPRRWRDGNPYLSHMAAK